VSCAKTAEPIDWVVDTSGPKEAQVQSYSPDGTNVPSRRAHWRNLANTIEQFICGGDAALCQLLWALVTIRLHRSYYTCT